MELCFVVDGGPLLVSILFWVLVRSAFSCWLGGGCASHEDESPCLGERLGGREGFVVIFGLVGCPAQDLLLEEVRL